MIEDVEEWRDVVGFEGHYSVSNQGRVRSEDRVVEYIKSGKVAKSSYKGKPMKPSFDKDGYHKYTLRRDGKPFDRRGHRLVAESFIPNPGNLPQVNHKDLDKVNNHESNLGWCNVEKNTIHYYGSVGEERNLSNLTYDDWKHALKLHLEGLSYADICEKIGIGRRFAKPLGDGLGGNRCSSVSGFTKDMRKKDNTVCQKITEAQVYDILVAVYTLGEMPSTFAKKYNISAATITRYLQGVRFKSVFEKFREDYPDVEVRKCK